MKKRCIALLMGCVVTLGMLTGCGANSGEFNKESEIIVVSREDGSGTRGAFVELFGLSKKMDDGSKYDMTSLEAIISNSTSVVMLSVKGNPYAIGYISLGSINDTIKPVKIDGVEPTIENVENGSYKVTRPFLIITKEQVSESAQDFIDFIQSEEGQAIVEKTGYVSVGNTGPYKGSAPTEKVAIAGSSSVAPLMEKLKEGYLTVNPDAKVEIQQSDSTVGVTSTAEGIVDIGMASRELKDSEKEKSLLSLEIARDAISLIINKENPIDNLTTEQVGAIYGGQTTSWAQIE